MDQDTGPSTAPEQPDPEQPREKLTRAQVMADPKNRRWIKVMGFSLLAAVGGSLLIGDLLLPDCEHEGCPAVERLRSYRPPEPPQIFDAQGELAGQLQGPRRTVIALDSIPALVRDGYIAVEDQRFREHGGVDFAGGMRAFLRNFRSGGVEQGASTITMQLARNVFGEEVLDYNKWHRKATELRTAKEIEDQLSKDEILELYLNMIYLGDGVWGVETAAQQYFGKPVMDVSTGEAALLIGLAKNPEGYNPRRNPERAVERRNLILDVLAADGLISAAEAEAAKAEEIVVTKDAGERTGWGTNAYYLGAVQRELRDMFPNPYDRRGLRVHTGLDQRAQRAAATALVTQIRAIEGGKWGRFRHEGAPAVLPRADGDSPYLQGMVVAMDVQTGLVTTLLGGRDFDHSEFDRAFMAKRQPGSSFKPIVYLTALASGLRPSEAIPTDQIRLAQRGSEDWTPDDHVSAQRLSVRDALVYSSNAASVRVGQRAGIDRVIDQAHAMGITTDLPRYPSIFLGAGEVIPAELVAAYATFGNGGHTIAPHFITRIEDGKGGPIYQREASGGVRAVDQRLGFLVLDMMRDVVRRGTGTRAAGIGVPVAGKTGTTNDYKDLWFIGLTPKLVAGVWLGFDRPATVIADAGGGDLAAPIWGQFMRVAARGQGGADWAPPPGVIQATVDVRSGMLWSESCVGGEPRTEYFLAGTEPLSQCRSFGTGWVMSPDGRWEFRGYGYDSLGSYGSQRVDTVEAWELNPDQYRTRFYKDSISPEELERRRRAQLDSMDAAQGRRRYGDSVRITPGIRPVEPADTQDQEPEDEPEPVPPTADPEPAPDPAPADTTGL